VTPQSQTDRYAEFYRDRRALRQLFRFDVRFRSRRTHEVLRELGIDTHGKRVLDVGFGGGDLLASFPKSCRVHGVDVSQSAVDAARKDPRFVDFASASFATIPEDDAEALPQGQFDIVTSAHALEHVPDDAATLAAIKRRLAPHGVLVLWVPIEEPDYIPFHLRAYSMQSIAERVRHSGFAPLVVEGSNHVNGHVWKLLTIPSRRAWPVVGPLVDALRLGSLSLLGYRGQRRADHVLHRLGVGPRQALVVARPR
jgi:2-polyprenyl-3-methyl-5-hydroxy-6-metoxy-1,4-benzoquinol methylase